MLEAGPSLASASLAVVSTTFSILISSFVFFDQANHSYHVDDAHLNRVYDSNAAADYYFHGYSESVVAVAVVVVVVVDDDGSSHYVD